MSIHFYSIDDCADDTATTTSPTMKTPIPFPSYITLRAVFPSQGSTYVIIIIATCSFNAHSKFQFYTLNIIFKRIFPHFFFHLRKKPKKNEKKKEGKNEEEGKTWKLLANTKTNSLGNRSAFESNWKTEKKVRCALSDENYDDCYLRYTSLQRPSSHLR